MLSLSPFCVCALSTSWMSYARVSYLQDGKGPHFSTLDKDDRSRPHCFVLFFLDLNTFVWQCVHSGQWNFKCPPGFSLAARSRRLYHVPQPSNATRWRKQTQLLRAIDNSFCSSLLSCGGCHLMSYTPTDCLTKIPASLARRRIRAESGRLKTHQLRNVSQLADITETVRDECLKYGDS